MNMISFVVSGEPNGQGRPRFSTHGGFVKAYDPEKSRNYKAFVKLMAAGVVNKIGWKCTELPVSIEIRAFMGIPSSKPKKFKERAILGVELPTKKPDIDNIVKCVTDAISGICYKDDKQIVSLLAVKKYSENPRVEVKINKLLNA